MPLNLHPYQILSKKVLTQINLYSTILYGIFGRLLTEAGVDEFNGAQGRILYVLWQENNLPIVELARKIGLAKTTFTSMLDRMESLGHIT